MVYISQQEPLNWHSFDEAVIKIVRLEVIFIFGSQTDAARLISYSSKRLQICSYAQVTLLDGMLTKQILDINDGCTNLKDASLSSGVNECIFEIRTDTSI